MYFQRNYHYLMEVSGMINKSGLDTVLPFRNLYLTVSKQITSIRKTTYFCQKKLEVELTLFQRSLRFRK
jgi:hypothetical protein